MKPDYGLILNIPLAILAVRWFRQFIDTETRLPQWDKLLTKSWMLFIPFLVIEVVFRTRIDRVGSWYLFSVACGLVAVLVAVRAYAPARTLLLALAPLMLHFLITRALSASGLGWVARYRDFIGSSQVFTYIWFITFAILARNQKKSLETDRLKQAAQTKHTRQVESQNTELEHLVEARTAELTSQKETLQQTLTHLQDAQKQLVQSEKMASLGELTAGIAHEIQNPLNFVNNFAEVSVELLDELRQELAKPELDTAFIRELTSDLSQNQQKIHHHGSRASAIVKAMLQHARTSTDERQPVDLNALADEFLRLAYHGFRAKDKLFNAELRTQFDPAVGRVTIAGQDMGRVLLNLFNNAFYSVKQQGIWSQAQGVPYQPTVAVSTRRLNDRLDHQTVEIRVRDNGLGVPQAVLDKIYQPFFTTKPTGEGTGLGLSISYDIITKGHNGTLTVDTAEHEFAEFVISLPTANGFGVS